MSIFSDEAIEAIIMHEPIINSSKWGLLEKNNTSTNKPKGITKLFVTANVELLTSTAPLFHIKYPKPVAIMPNHNIAITSTMPKDSGRL